MLTWMLSKLPLKLLKAALQGHREVAGVDVTLWSDVPRLGPDISSDAEPFTEGYFSESLAEASND